MRTWRSAGSGRRRRTRTPHHQRSRRRPRPGEEGPWDVPLPLPPRPVLSLACDGVSARGGGVRNGVETGLACLALTIRSTVPNVASTAAGVLGGSPLPPFQAAAVDVAWEGGDAGGVSPLTTRRVRASQGPWTRPWAAAAVTSVAVALATATVTGAPIDAVGTACPAVASLVTADGGRGGGIGRRGRRAVTRSVIILSCYNIMMDHIISCLESQRFLGGITFRGNS